MVSLVGCYYHCMYVTRVRGSYLVCRVGRKQPSDEVPQLAQVSEEVSNLVALDS